MERTQRRIAFIFAAAIGIAGSSRGAETDWTGSAGSGLWSDAGNWNNGVPVAGEATVIDVNNAVVTDNNTAAAGLIKVGYSNFRNSTVNQTAATTTASSLYLGAPIIGNTSGPATGTWNISGNAILNINQSFAQLIIGASGSGIFTQSDLSQVNVTGNMTVGNAGGTGTYTISGGTLNTPFLTVGDIAASSNSTGTMTVQGGTANINVNLDIGDSTNNNILNQSGGTIAVSSFAAAYIGGKGMGTFNDSGGQFNVGTGGEVDVGQLSTGAWTLTKNAAANVNGAMYVGGGSKTNNGGTGVFTDSTTGTVQIQSAIINAGSKAIFTSNNVPPSTGPTFISDSVQVLGGATNGGVWQGPVDVVKYSGGAVTGTSFTNSGIVYVGSSATTGQMTIYGTYTQTADSLIRFQLGGLTPATQFDDLVTTASASLDGTMTATLVNGFDPQLGNAFPIIEGTGVNGTFSTTNLPTLDPGLSWQVQYNPNNVTLLVVAAGVPEPGSALALASAAGVLLLRRRR